MPRRARLALPNVPLHLIQRGNNRQACFFSDEDYRLYLDWLGEHAGKTGCRVHAYVLMINHVRSFDVPLSFQPLLSFEWVKHAGSGIGNRCPIGTSKR